LLAPELRPGMVPSRAPGNVDELGCSIGSCGGVVALLGAVPGAAPAPLAGGGGPASG
jgi:hypothetical protein